MKQKSIALLSQVLGVLLAVLLIGCAGGSAKRVRLHTEIAQLPRPSVMLIYNFAVDSDDVIIDTFGPNFVGSKKVEASDRLKKGRVVADALSEQLVEKLVESGINAQRATVSTQVPVNAFVVKGQFVTIDEGDQSQRVAIGLGAGQDEIQVQVQIYQMAEDGNLRRIADAEGEAHGRKTPGIGPPAIIAAGGGTAVGVVVSSGMNIKSEAIGGSMTTNIKNLAEELVERAVKFFER